MKLSRRKFIQASSIFGTGLLTSKVFPQKIISNIHSTQNKNRPLIIST